jgi:hypothetical protein
MGRFVCASYTILYVCAVFMYTAVIHLTMLHVFFNREQISKTLLGQAFHYILRLLCENIFFVFFIGWPFSEGHCRDLFQEKNSPLSRAMFKFWDTNTNFRKNSLNKKKCVSQ